MGTLQPNMTNVNYSTSGELSPLLKDPYLRTIGIGTKIFLAGAEGFISWQETQFAGKKPRGENGIPLSPSCTLAVIGDLNQMSTKTNLEKQAKAAVIKYRRAIAEYIKSNRGRSCIQICR